MLKAAGVDINLQKLIETAQKLRNTKSKQQAKHAYQAVFMGFQHVAQEGLQAVLVHESVKQ